MSRYRAFIILILDVLTIFLCNFLTMLPYLLGQDIRLLNLVLHIGLLTVCVLLFQVCLKTYDTLWRYAESQEYLTLLEGMGLGFALYSVMNLLLGHQPHLDQLSPDGDGAGAAGDAGVPVRLPQLPAAGDRCRRRAAGLCGYHRRGIGGRGSRLGDG